MSTWLGAAFGVVLAVVLVTAARIEALRGSPRSRWLSFSGGVAVTYVFLGLFPELVRAFRSVSEQQEFPEWLREHVLFLVALAGALVLFGIERAAKRTKEERRQHGGEERSAGWVFAAHLALMSVYVAFVGYLLFRQETGGALAVAVFGTVMALHFGGISVGLAEDYRALYLRIGRPVLAAAVLAGALAGWLRPLPELARHLLLGFLAGAIVFSVIKEEIPPEKASRFWAVALGVASAGTLLLAVG